MPRSGPALLLSALVCVALGSIGHAQRAAPVGEQVGPVRVELEPVCSENRVARLRFRRPARASATTILLRELRVGGASVALPPLSAIVGGRPFALQGAGYSWVAGTGEELAIHAALPRPGSVTIKLMIDGTEVQLTQRPGPCLGGSGLPED